MSTPIELPAGSGIAVRVPLKDRQTKVAVDASTATAITAALARYVSPARPLVQVLTKSLGSGITIEGTDLVVRLTGTDTRQLPGLYILEVQLDFGGQPVSALPMPELRLLASPILAGS